MRVPSPGTRSGGVRPRAACASYCHVAPSRGGGVRAPARRQVQPEGRPGRGPAARAEDVRRTTSSGQRASIVWQLRLRGEASPSLIGMCHNTRQYRAQVRLSWHARRATRVRGAQRARARRALLAVAAGRRGGRAAADARLPARQRVVPHRGGKGRDSEGGGGTLQARWRKPLRE